MHEWVDYITNNCEENGLWMTGFQYGDWLALDKEESADRTGATDKYMIANAYYLYVTDLVKQTADVLGYADEKEKYAALYEKTLAGIIPRLIERLPQRTVQLNPGSQPIEGRLRGNLRRVSPRQLTLAIWSYSHLYFI